MACQLTELARRYNWLRLAFLSLVRILHPWIRLGTIFYLGYLAFEFPQNLALQRFPVGKWMRLVSHALHEAPFSEVIRL